MTGPPGRLPEPQIDPTKKPQDRVLRPLSSQLQSIRSGRGNGGRIKVSAKPKAKCRKRAMHDCYRYSTERPICKPNPLERSGSLLKRRAFKGIELVSHFELDFLDADVRLGQRNSIAVVKILALDRDQTLRRDCVHMSHERAVHP